MTNDLLIAYVTEAEDRQVRVKTLKDFLQKDLINTGFVFDSDLMEYVFCVNDEKEKAILFDRLRQLNIFFSGGREWCPSEVFEDLRRSGLITGTFKKISWTSPEHYIVTAA